jgi:N-acetylglutamate synthase-like GNAT family acetyltransferase
VKTMTTTTTSKPKKREEEILGNVRPSIHFCMIRHAESGNNEVYRNAKFLYRAGTDDFDREGCEAYISTHRKADPYLSTKGYAQAEALADYLVPHLMNQASYPFRILVSPMRRTLLTIKPTLERLRKIRTERGDGTPKVQILVVAYYFETEGCHLRGKAEEGMTPNEIRYLLKDCVSSDPEENKNQLQFIGFPHSSGDRGWYADGTGPETRAEAEVRAAKYCLWLSEYFDQQLQQDGPESDVFDASIAMEGDSDEDEHDKHATRTRRRRTYLAIGHGDFMSTVLKRFTTGFGHYVENDGIPHRSAFAHFNTGITELEYFGHGRYLIMSTNQTPHIQVSQYKDMRSGGTLKDGWSFLMPTDEAILRDAEVCIVFSDTDLEEHIREQSVALKALYLSSGRADSLKPASAELEVEEEQEKKERSESHIIVKRGLQVLGVATYSEDTGQLCDVAIRPTANKDDSVAETLMQAVKTHARKLGRSSSLVVHPRSTDAMKLFKKMGFEEIDDADETDQEDKKQTMTSLL